MFFRWIFRQVIQLRLWRFDVLVIPNAHRAERRPTERIVGMQAFAIDRMWRGLALEAGRDWQVKKIEDGGSDIDQAAELILGGVICRLMED